MAELLGKRKLVNVILWIATFTIVGGLFLYWHDWHLYGGLGRFLDTGFGIGLTVGAVAAVLERWQKIDYLVAVAGGFAAGKSYETDERNWDHMFNLNLRSVYLAVHAVVPHMIRQNFGRIVTVSSGAIQRGGGAGIAAYAISKTAVLKLSEILADELKDYDIHVHCVLPGTIDTAANRAAMRKADFSKWVKTEDVAGVIRTLRGDKMSAARSVAVPVLG